jgi:AcrR family transcriptional regulator
MSISISGAETGSASGTTHGAFTYVQELDERLARAASAPKAARTRLRLMAAIAALLDAEGFHTLRVADCTTRAGLAHGTFYRYWPDLKLAAREVLEDFMRTVSARRPPPARGSPLYGRIVAANRYYVRVYHANAGLMRCLMQLGNVEAEFARIGQAANMALAERIVRAWQRAEPSVAALPESERFTRALACIAMVEGVLRDLYVRPALRPLREIEEDALADLLSACWFRMLFARDPPVGERQR